VQPTRKIISAAGFKTISEGAGGFEGIGNKSNYVDFGADIILSGAWATCLDEFKLNGFAPDTHAAASGWVYTYSSLVAYPTGAEETEDGLSVRMMFHSDQPSQDVRTKMKERSDAKLSNSMSIGFGLEESDYYFLSAKDYAEKIPQLVPTNCVQQCMSAAQEFDSLRVITHISKLYEVSPVLTPMNDMSLVSMVKNEFSSLKERMTFEQHTAKLQEALVNYLDRANKIAALNKENNKIGRTYSEATMTNINSYCDAAELGANDVLKQVQGLRGLIAQPEKSRTLSREQISAMRGKFNFQHQ
jgi:hypothetical protein